VCMAQLIRPRYIGGIIASDELDGDQWMMTTSRP
jgi:hypothetical protein